MTSADNLRGKRVLVTGGAGGVGRAVAVRMVAAGARVLLADRDEALLRQVTDPLHGEEGSDAAIDFIATDLADTAGIARMFERVDSWLGGIDILVACAGVGSGPLLEMAEPDWRYVIEG